MSANAGAAVENKVSRYKPPKNYTLTRTPCGECFVESLIPEKSGTDTVIFHIHGGSFKIKLIDAYRRLALKYSRAAGGAAVFSVDYTRMSSPRQKIYNFFCSFSGSFIAAHSCFKWVFTVILPFRIP